MLDGILTLRESTAMKNITKRLCECGICHGDKGDDPSVCKCTCNQDTSCNSVSNSDQKGSTSLSENKRSSSDKNFWIQCSSETDCACIYHTLWNEVKAFDGHVCLVDAVISNATSALQMFLSKQVAQEVSALNLYD